MPTFCISTSCMASLAMVVVVVTRKWVEAALDLSVCV